MKAKARHAALLLEGKCFVCRSLGNGFVVMNVHRQWTPITSLAHPFDANYAAHLAKWSGGYTQDSLIRDDTPAP
jgi:hypothetical protein